MRAHRTTVLTTVLCALLALQSGAFAFLDCAMAAGERCCCHNHDAKDDSGTEDDLELQAQVKTGPCCCAASAADREQSAAVAPDARTGSMTDELLDIPIVHTVASNAPLVLPAPPVPKAAAGPPIRLQTCTFLI